MATIEKRGENSWRISKSYKGKRYRITVEAKEKPSSKEAEHMIQRVILEDEENRIDTDKPLKEKTFKMCAEEYIISKEPILSASTVRGYRAYLRNLPESFTSKLILNITQVVLQTLASKYVKEHSVKYAKNMIGFCKAVLNMFRTDANYKIDFGLDTTKEPEEAYIPTEEELNTILELAKGTEYEIPIKLASICGVRRSELIVLTVDDLDEDNILHIDKARVLNNNNEWIDKGNKTRMSKRCVAVPDELADAIRAQGYIYKGHPNSITKWLGTTEKRLGIEHFSLHKLRHYFCTSLHREGIPEADILKAGGWSDPSVMKRVYRHGNSDIENLKHIANVAKGGLK